MFVFSHLNTSGTVKLQNDQNLKNKKTDPSFNSCKTQFVVMFVPETFVLIQTEHIVMIRYLQEYWHT